jgi:hypothetical protein
LVKIQDMSFFLRSFLFLVQMLQPDVADWPGVGIFFHDHFWDPGQFWGEKLLLDQRLDGDLRYSKDWDSRKRRMIYASSQVCIWPVICSKDLALKQWGMQTRRGVLQPQNGLA